jgi:endonuclease YncB( thermonuclease family)
MTHNITGKPMTWMQCIVFIILFLSIICQTVLAEQVEEILLPPIFNETVTVLDVLDGVTLRVTWKVQDVLGVIDKIENIKLIGLQSLDRKSPQKTVQQYADKAYAKLQKSLTGQVLRLKNDASQGNRDQTEHMLRYAWLEDDRLLNLVLIQTGYVLAAESDPPHQYQPQFLDAQQIAQKKKIGLWMLDAYKKK